jgi:pimeloyl-ACP methyl ester carboxylesterase
MHGLYLRQLGASVRYHDLPGQEPACVYLHGFGAAASADFPGIVRDPRLAPWRAILVDLPGFGFSDRPADFPYTFEAHATVIAGLLDRLGLRKCHVVGHSMGGSIAIVLAAARPDLVAHLIVGEPSLDGEDAFFSGTIVARWPTEEEYVASGHATIVAEADAEARGEPNSLALGAYAGTARAADPRHVPLR